jgi:basic amino acid/polyamine antiporter, APA family
MTFIRSIGRWTMTALVINCIIGGGIFGVPSELTRLLGRASPIAMIVGALGMSVIMAAIAEVASQFSYSGGPYLYVRTAFGRFAGMQVGWFLLLSNVASVAALASLFVNYFATFLPFPLTPGGRALLIAILLAIPAAVNYIGVRSGACLNNLMTLAKLSPLLLLIVAGVLYFFHRPEMIHASDIASPGIRSWLQAMVLLLFTIGGWENSAIPAAEIREPRRTIPFGLFAGLIACTIVYTLLQFITVTVIGTMPTNRPLAATAAVLLGPGGATFVSIAVMVSTYGWISASLLHTPRLAFSLADQGDFPRFFARVHARFHTPTTSIVVYAVAAWILASSGTFLRLVGLSSGFMAVFYAATCVSLLRLRRMHPAADALRIPFGRTVGVLGAAVSLTVMTGLDRAEVEAIIVTSAIAALNWGWAKWHGGPKVPVEAPAR